MRKLFLLLMLVGMSFGCADDNIEGDGQKPDDKLRFSISKDELNFSEYADSYAVKVSCSQAWSVRSSNDTWCKVSVDKGDAGENMIVNISVDSNDLEPDSYDDRKAVVTFKSGEESLNLNVNQKKKGAIIITKDKYDNIPFTGGIVSIEVKSNVDVDFSTSDTWIRPAAKGKAMTTTTTDFIVEPSSSETVRKGYIYATERFGSLKDTIEVFQAERGTLVLVSRRHCVTDAKSTFEVDLKTNIEYSVTPIDTWLHYVETRAARTDKITLSADANTGNIGRWGKVVFKDLNSTVSDTLSVYQTYGDALVVSPMSDVADSRGETITVITKLSSYTANVNHDDAEWIKPLSSENSVHTFTISPNNSGDDRTGQITVNGNGKSEHIVIAQSTRDIVSASARHFNISSNGDNIDVKILSNVSVSFSMPTWINQVTAKGATTSSVRFSITANDTKVHRYGEIIAKSNIAGVADTVHVYQGSADKMYVYVHKDSIVYYSVQDVGAVLSCKALKLAGHIDSMDLVSLNMDFNALKDLDMEDVELKNGRIPIRAFCWVDMGLGNPFIENIVLPLNVKTIGQEAFRLSKIKKMPVLPEGLEVIGSQAFRDCQSMKGPIVFPKSLKIIDVAAFGNCPVLSGNLYLPSTLQQLGMQAFYECKSLTGNITIPASIKNVDYGTFYNCSGFNGSINLASGLTTISQDAFKGCSGVTNGLLLPESLLNIEDAAFEGCAKLNGKLTITKNIKTIGDRAFAGCSGFSSLELPEKATSIGANVFLACIGINSVTSNAVIPYKANDAFITIAENASLTVPQGTKSRYMATDDWKTFVSIKEAGTGNVHIAAQGDRMVAAKKGAKHTIKLLSSGAWSIDSKPDWVDLSKNSGNGDESIEITINSMTQGISRDGNIVFRLNGTEMTFTLPTLQIPFEYGDGEARTVQTAKRGRGITVVIMGDGYTVEEVESGKYDRDMDRAVAAYFMAEPYKSYRDYFTVKIVYAFSNESGITDLTKVVDTKFSVKYMSGRGNGTLMDVSETAPIQYAYNATGATNTNGMPVIVVANSPRYGGTALMYESGASIAVCPVSEKAAPNDFEALIIHEACGHGLALLTEEYWTAGNPMTQDNRAQLEHMQSLGWFMNVDLTNNAAQVHWSHLIGRAGYKRVGVYEGGHQVEKSVWRSEENSCMRSMGRYFDAWSRELIVRRIKQLAGEPYNFDDFLLNDVDDYATSKSRAIPAENKDPSMITRSRIIKGSPQVYRKR